MIVIIMIVLIGIGSLLGVWYYYSSNSESQNVGKNKIKVPKFVSTVSKYGAQSILSPMGVATAKNKVFLLDSGNGKLAVLSSNGSFEKSFSLTEGSEKSLPVGIAVDNEDRIYVSMIGSTNRIAVFNESGNLLYNFPQMNKNKINKSKSKTNSVIGRPVGLCIFEDKILVTDVIDQDIKIFDLSGKLLKRFGKPGSRNGEFLYPNGIAVSDDGLIFVSDSNNARVQVFKENGSFAYMFAGPKKDRLALPRGIALDQDKRLHIVDTLKHKVFIYSKQGKLLSSYGSFGNRGGGLSYPNAIAFGEAYKKIYLADKQNNRLSIWQP